MFDERACLQTEKIMKALFIRRLYIWPRWEAQVKDVLSSDDQNIEVRTTTRTCVTQYAMPLPM